MQMEDQVNVDGGCGRRMFSVMTDACSKFTGQTRHNTAYMITTRSCRAYLLQAQSLFVVVVVCFHPCAFQMSTGGSMEASISRLPNMNGIRKRTGSKLMTV